MEERRKNPLLCKPKKMIRNCLLIGVGGNRGYPRIFLYPLINLINLNLLLFPQGLASLWSYVHERGVL